MGDIARCSLGGKDDLLNEELLYRMFGVNAELLIDHAWGWEPCTIEDIKAYRPASNSIGSGQVLHCPYEADRAKLVVHEMTDLLALDLVDKRLVTDQLVLTIGFDRENLSDPARRKRYRGPVTTDFLRPRRSQACAWRHSVLIRLRLLAAHCAGGARAVRSDCGSGSAGPAD